MPEGWLPDDPLPVISTACGQQHHDDCQTPNCGCLCHLNPATDGSYGGLAQTAV